MPISFESDSNAITLIKRLNGKALEMTALYLRDPSKCENHKWYFFEDNKTLTRKCLICGSIEPVFNWTSIPLTLKKICVISASIGTDKITPRMVKTILNCSSSTAWSYYATIVQIKRTLGEMQEDELYIQPRTLKELFLLFKVLGKRKVTWQEVKKTLNVSRTSARRYHAAFEFIQERLILDSTTVTHQPNIGCEKEVRPQVDANKQRYIQIGKKLVADIKFSEQGNVYNITEIKRILAKNEDRNLSAYFKNHPKAVLHSKRAMKMFKHAVVANSAHVNFRHIVALTDYQHPLIKALLLKGTRRMSELGDRSKSYYILGNTYGIKLRKIGYFFASANIRSSNVTIDELVNACFITCLKDYGLFLKIGENIENSRVDKELLEAIDLFLLLT